MRTQTPQSVDRKRVGIWIRVSTEDQARGESPEHHEQRARFYAQAKGWEVREVYHLEAVSGKTVMRLPETERMLSHVRSKHITGLIFSKLARLARNTRELLEFAEIFRDEGADLVSLQESIDTSSPAGRLFYTMIAAMAQWEREETSERVAASVPIRAKLGKSLGGAAPYGYRWVDKQLLPEPTEAPIRRLVHELFLEQRRLKTVAETLNERGYRTRSGHRFSDTTIRRLLEDPTAKGVRRANYTKSLGANRGWKLKPKEDWVLLPVEPIVPAELWDQAFAILEDRKLKGKRPARRATHLFTGLVECACGTRMYVPSNNPKYICKKCRNKIPLGDLEAVYREQLHGLLVSPEEIGQFLASAEEEVKAKELALASLLEERKSVAAGKERLLQPYLRGELSPEAFGRAYQPLDDRLVQIEQELPRLQAEVDLIRIQYLSRDELLQDARSLYERWADLTAEEKRQVVEITVHRIVVGRNEVEIDLASLPCRSSVTDKQHWHARADGSAARCARAAAWRAKWHVTAAACRGRCVTASTSGWTPTVSRPSAIGMPRRTRPRCACRWRPRASARWRAEA